MVKGEGKRGGGGGRGINNCYSFLLIGGVGPIRFCFGVFFSSVGYACAAAMLLAVFTKLLDESEQVR